MALVSSTMLTEEAERAVEEAQCGKPSLAAGVFRPADLKEAEMAEEEARRLRGQRGSSVVETGPLLIVFTDGAGFLDNADLKEAEQGREEAQAAAVLLNPGGGRPRGCGRCCTLTHQLDALRRQQFYKALEEAGPEAAASVAHSVISSMHSGSASSIQTLPPSLALEPAGPPTPPAAFLFPGQGSQAVGMLKDCHQIPAVRSMLDKANDVLGYNLLDVCLNGPKEKLDNTCFAQPALFVAGLAAVEVLRSTDPSALSRCVAAAGLSLGEYSALVFAGALSFEDGLKVVLLKVVMQVVLLLQVVLLQVVLQVVMLQVVMQVVMLLQVVMLQVVKLCCEEMAAVADYSP
eukprot:gene30961-17152_t